MKKMLMLALVLIGGAIFAEEVPVQTAGWNDAIIWATDNDSYVMTPNADEKSAMVAVKKVIPGDGINNIQCWVQILGSDLPNGKYRMECKVKSNKSFRAGANVILAFAPWTGYARSEYTLNANQETTVSLSFELKDSAPEKVFRVPCLGLGLAPEGTEITLSDVKLVAIK